MRSGQRVSPVISNEPSANQTRVCLHEIDADDMPGISERPSAPNHFRVVSPSSSPQQNMPMSAATMKKSNSEKYSKIADMACSSYFLR
jgi:hypothetical protein